MKYDKGQDYQGAKAELGDIVGLESQVQDVVKCQESGVLMLNIDADELKPGDLSFIKSLGLTISDPETLEPVALGVEVARKSLGRRLSEWIDSDDTDDSSFFSSTPSRSGSVFGGSSGFGGFGGGFGGFGGGSFGGGGASRGF